MKRLCGNEEGMRKRNSEGEEEEKGRIERERGRVKWRETEGEDD